MLIKFVGGKRVMPMVGYMVGVWVLLRLVTPNKELLAQRLVVIIIIVIITIITIIILMLGGFLIC